MRLRFGGLIAIVSVAICVCALEAADAGDDPSSRLAEKIMSTSHPDSTAVLVLFDEDLVQGLRSRLPQPFKVVPFRHPDVPHHDAFVPAQLGQMYREASAATWSCSDVWVIGRLAGPTGRRRATGFADMAASMVRSRVLRDSLKTSRGMVTFSRWVDRPGGAAQRAETRRALEHADSVLARGIPKPTPITRPFTLSELQLNRDTLSYFVARLADTSFYSIGGCSEVDLVFWDASEGLGRLGPGVVPVLVERITDPNPFVRERIQEALGLVTQDERILARTNGEYLKFYDQPEGSAPEIVRAWWTKFARYWVPADSTR